MNDNRYTPPGQKIGLILFGILLFLIFLEIALRGGGLMLQFAQEYNNRIALYKKGAYRIMCIGESTTALGSTPGKSDSYPALLEKFLNDHQKGLTFTVINRGIPASNTTALIQQLDYNCNTYNPDMIIAMMGINDDPHVIPWDSASAQKNSSSLKNLKLFRLVLLLKEHIKAQIKPLTDEERPPAIKKQNVVTLQAVASKKEEPPTVSSGEKSEELQKPFYNNDDLFMEGRRLKEKGEFIQAKSCFEKAIIVYPQNFEAYFDLSGVYLELRNFSEMRKTLEKALQLNPKSAKAYLRLALLCESQDEFAAAEQYFNKAIYVDPSNTEALRDVGWFYMRRGKFIKARDFFEKAVFLDPRDDKAYGGLALAYNEMKEYMLASDNYKKAESIRMSYYKISTVENYIKLKEISDKKRIKLVCAQYPMRSVEPLKKIFYGKGKGIIFVDNEKLFKDVVKRDGYRVYFTDMFAGDFGHCTEEGNRLLAENIAKAIMDAGFR